MDLKNNASHDIVALALERPGIQVTFFGIDRVEEIINLLDFAR